MAWSARFIFSCAPLISTGAYSAPPALTALAIADFETAICSVGGGMLAQPATTNAAQAATTHSRRPGILFIVHLAMRFPSLPRLSATNLETSVRWRTAADGGSRASGYGALSDGSKSS